MHDQLKYHISSNAADKAQEGGHAAKEKISVTFVYKDGEEKHIKVPIGMSMLEAAHENGIDLEGLVNLACQVIARPELDGMRLALPAATRNFAVNGYKPKPHWKVSLKRKYQRKLHIAKIGNLPFL